ncbi:MAG: hypothetical protein GX561_15090 [Lentisphaerae bacterium]|jgi:UDP-N-acetylmuramate--alanine ligase|nr:hypothetical protein [Lentisphaerota bacterium]
MKDDSILPPPPAKIFLVGIGGIGVSGLAQLLASRGYHVAGSDRGLKDQGKEQLYEDLKSQGVILYPQDGSGPIAEKPDAIVISTAVESDNPDLLANPDIPVIHRAAALAQTIDKIDAPQIAIAGSCGKTSVTGWIAQALQAIDYNVLMINGGYALDDEKPGFPGNAKLCQNPDFIVVEVDESDKSLSAFHPDYAVLLNVGNDHYGQDELCQVFADFLAQASKGIAILDSLKGLAGIQGKTIVKFAEQPQENAIAPSNFSSSADGIRFDTAQFGTIHSSQTGFYSAINACAVLATLKLVAPNTPNDKLAQAIAAFSGIRQRFEIIGKASNGTVVVNDYAHNPEKLNAAIQAAQLRFGSPIAAIFQPHGFKPLGFMRKALVEALKSCLSPDDLLVMLPVFYAGGTASFSPTSDQVAEELKQQGINAIAKTRDETAKLLKQQPFNVALVMGARDASLRTWSKILAEQ